MKNILYISLMIVILYGCGRKNANYSAADAEATGKMSYMEESASFWRRLMQPKPRH